MTKRAFIRCSLDAVLAAKNFGFQFHVYPTPDQIIEYGTDKPWDWMETCCSEAACEEVNTIEDAIEFIKNVSPERLYVAPDSMPLLEPVIGDYAMCDDAEIRLINYDLELFDQRHDIKYIMTRDGKPFPKIEWEEAE